MKRSQKGKHVRRGLSSGPDKRTGFATLYTRPVIKHPEAQYDYAKGVAMTVDVRNVMCPHERNKDICRDCANGGL